MDIHSFREAQAAFIKRYKQLEEERRPLYDLRERFVNYFNTTKLKSLAIDEYVIGLKAKNRLNFCYTLERELERLGRITGSPAFKFGVYYGMTKSDQTKKYRFSKKYGETVDEAFSNVINDILKLLDAGKHHDLKSISEIPLAQTFKGKILSIYFPETYLSIFSSDHVNRFLRMLNIKLEDDSDMEFVHRQKLLLDFKNKDEVLRTWSVDLFVHFLYHVFPERGGEKIPEILVDYIEDDFPPVATTEVIELSLSEASELKGKAKFLTGPKKTDYEKLYRRAKRLGDRGEKIVFDLECARVGQKKRSLVKWVSREDDSLGYDIQSVDSSGKEILIEVKSTTASPGSFQIFLSDNELKTAKSRPSFQFWIVFEVHTSKPKVWKAGNPFRNVHASVSISPIAYKVAFNAKAKKR